MNKMLQVIFTANNLSTGIILPVLTLVLLERGANLQTLPLLMAVHSLTVLLLELPSGIFADMIGRKAVFLISCAFQLLSFTLLLVSYNLVGLVSGIVFLGIGRAFSSGSLDAILIDQTMDKGGGDCLPKVTSRLAVLEGAGLAAGSIAGGFAASAFGTYGSIIIIRLILTSIVTLLSLLFIGEPPRRTETGETVPLTSFTGILGQGRRLIINNRKLGLVLMGVFFIGFFLFTLETYWQPAFTSIPHTAGKTWLLGVITFIGFFSATAGNYLAHKLLSRSKVSWWNVFAISRAIMAVILLIFAVVNGVAGFISLYAGIYLLLGTGNVPESSLVNKYTPNEMRASMLSLNSLISQLGGLCASLFSSLLVNRLHFSGIWLTAGILMGCYAVFLSLIPAMPTVKSLVPALFSKIPSLFSKRR